MKIIELHRTGTPFAVIVSKEITGVLYTLLYKDRFIRCYKMKKWEIRWFNDNKYIFNQVFKTERGHIYEYRKFKRQMSEPLKHNFLIRNQIIKGAYI